MKAPVFAGLAADDPAVGEWLAATGRSAAALQDLVQRRPRCGLAREQSLVCTIYLFTHRHYRATADQLIVHFAQFPGDEIAGSMLSACDLAGSLECREHGQALAEQQYALAGPESWPWASWPAGARAEQGRPDEAWAPAEHALRLSPRSGPAAHARAHAGHDHGSGPAAIAFIDT
ncbi:hypothetical protein ACFP1Z_12575 [Streptomyces gamaensis]|uniref:DUF4158 domain-containing protein n=1 Tax=Streptomyces gamaensis TaxID=1763542 RepID=A0ABW0YZC6_9ACTN